MKTKRKKISMFKNGEWVKWDGSDVNQLMIEETRTMTELKKNFLEKYKSILNIQFVTDIKKTVDQQDIQEKGKKK